MISIQNYKKVQSLQEAYELNQKRSTRILGGMMWMRLSSGNIGTAIDLSGLGLDTIEETDTEFRIGCMCSL
ncbi:MAG TPA: molybdopterin dehydrogenase, partial [Lachnospiraceae bacterium]|nr:molybdopterin dehydrogenase [Lachnospiraceae bacterium]